MNYLQILSRGVAPRNKPFFLPLDIFPWVIVLMLNFSCNTRWMIIFFGY